MIDFTRHQPRREGLRLATTTSLAGLLLVALAAFAGASGAAPTTQAAPPTNTSKPSITGEAREGETLTATTGSWRGDRPISYSFQWIRCSVRISNCNEIRGATRNTYRLTANDVGRRLLVSVTARNSDGDRSASSDPTAQIAQRANAPANSAPPTISGTPQEGEALTVSNGTWTGTAPITFAYAWQRCDRNGGSCAPIAGAAGQQYLLTSADVNNTVRAVVTGRNAAGSTSATTVPSAVIAPRQPVGPEGQIRLPSGKVSIPISSVALPHRLVIDQVRFSPNPVRSRNITITAQFRVADTRGFVVRGALVFVRSVPLLTSTPPEQTTQQDGTVTFQITPRATFPLRNGVNVQFFIRARKAGESALAGVSTRRLVQVRTAR
jgi:hypothetical protein